jgi:hypothetical protein
MFPPDRPLERTRLVDCKAGLEKDKAAEIFHDLQAQRLLIEFPGAVDAADKRNGIDEAHRIPPTFRVVGAIQLDAQNA